MYHVTFFIYDRDIGIAQQAIFLEVCLVGARQALPEALDQVVKLGALLSVLLIMRDEVDCISEIPLLLFAINISEVPMPVDAEPERVMSVRDKVDPSWPRFKVGVLILERIMHVLKVADEDLLMKLVLALGDL